MIVPTKYIDISRSLIGVGATLLRHIDEMQTVSSLWYRVKILPEIKTFDRFNLALDFLFLIGAIEFKDGYIQRVKNA